MKKMLLIIMCLLLCSCYNYIEVNNLCFISSIGIDYDKKFNITFEIIEEKKEVVSSSSVSTTGNTISEAFDDLTLKINKKPFYYHLKAIVISKEVATNHLEELTDFFLRSPEIRKEFFLVVSDNAEKIINSKSKSQTIGDEISSAIKTSYYNSSYNRTFQDFLEKVLNDKMDAITTEVSLENDSLIIKGIALFKEYKYVGVLSGNDATLLNILNNNKASLLISKKYNDNTLSISAYESDTSYNFEKNKVIININLKAEINENGPNFDLHKESVYQKLNKDFSKVLEKDVNILIDKIKKLNCDPLGLRQKYYTKKRKINHNIMDEYDFKVNVKLIINRKGLIYKVENE